MGKKAAKRGVADLLFGSGIHTQRASRWVSSLRLIAGEDAVGVVRGTLDSAPSDYILLTTFRVVAYAFPQVHPVSDLFYSDVADVTLSPEGATVSLRAGTTMHLNLSEPGDDDLAVLALCLEELRGTASVLETTAPVAVEPGLRQERKSTRGTEAQVLRVPLVEPDQMPRTDGASSLVQPDELALWPIVASQPSLFDAPTLAPRAANGHGRGGHATSVDATSDGGNYRDLPTGRVRLATDFDDSVGGRYVWLSRQWSKNNGIAITEVHHQSQRDWEWQCEDASHVETWWASVPARLDLDNHDVQCPECWLPREGLAVLHPALVAEFDETQNHVAATSVLATSSLGYWWKCSRNARHAPWEASIAERLDAKSLLSHCPQCWDVGGTRWDRQRILRFIRDLAPQIGTLNTAQLFAICQQSGFAASSSKHKKQLLDAILSGDVAALGAMLDDAVLDGDEYASLTSDDDLQENSEPQSIGHVDPDPVAAKDASGLEDDLSALPTVSTTDLIMGTGRLMANADADTAQFLQAATVHELWLRAYRAEQDAPAEQDQLAEILSGLPSESRLLVDNYYANEVQRQFRHEFERAQQVSVPPGWAFRPRPGGPVIQPNLMQRHIASLVQDRRRVGNWSGTGAGKTVGAVLSASTINAGTNGVVLVVCPNNVVAGWKRTIPQCLPAAEVATKTLSPTWSGTGPRWLVVNYERLSQANAAQELFSLIERDGVDMFVIDEIHYAKSTGNPKDDSKRRKTLSAAVTEAGEKNAALAVLGMSATPVINSLAEARSLLELIEGEDLSDLSVGRTINDAMTIHQRIVRTGIRWLPSYQSDLDTTWPEVEAPDLLEDLIATKGRPAATDRTLLLAKIPLIVKECKEAVAKRGDRVLIYTEFVDQIAEPLAEALSREHLRVGMFTGDNKEGLARFTGVNPDTGEPEPNRIDVLIGSSAIGVGVDGLQHHASTLIFASLPWTHAAYMQVVGRLHRQQQEAEKVSVIIPIVFINVRRPDGEIERWSWDDKRWARVLNKRTLADCAVDGRMPSADLVSVEEAAKRHIRWLERLSHGDVTERPRRRLDERDNAWRPTQAPVGKAPRHVIGTWQQAERAVADWMKWRGFAAVSVTQGGPDGGVDVTSETAVAQVKWQRQAMGVEPLRETVGAAEGANRQPLFFSRSEYTAPAMRYAQTVGLPLFRLYESGEVVAVNEYAYFATDDAGRAEAGVF